MPNLNNPIKNKEWQVGKQVKIMSKIHGQGFAIGEVVTIVKKEGNSKLQFWVCESEDDWYWLTEEEAEFID